MSKRMYVAPVSNHMFGSVKKGDIIQSVLSLETSQLIIMRVINWSAVQMGAAPK